MAKRLEQAAEAALAILEVGGNGEGWTAYDAILMLRAGLGRDVSDEDRARIAMIAPEVLEEDYAVVGPHDQIQWTQGRGPAPWRCHRCGKIGSGAVADEPTDYPCLEDEGA